jgi:hypothetical protein
VALIAPGWALATMATAIFSTLLSVALAWRREA